MVVGQWYQVRDTTRQEKIKEDQAPFGEACFLDDLGAARQRYLDRHGSCGCA